MSGGLPDVIWSVTAGEPEPPNHPLPERRVDVAIVGGGYTGLSTALHCAEAGLAAHVIEAGSVGSGGSGRNVGLVNAGVWMPPRRVRAALGAERGARFLERFGAGPEMVFGLIEAHQIRCGATREGTIHAAHAPSGMAGLRARWADWHQMGAPVDLLSRAQMRRLTGSGAFCGGLLDRRAGTVNPLAYCRGLARAAVAAGARISTGTAVHALHREGEYWRLDTAAGEVHAHAVVLATNAYTGDLWPGLARSVCGIDYFQLATEPLGARVDAILPGGQGLWDTGRIMLSLRRDEAGRLIVGSMGRVMGDAERGLSRRWAARQLARLFPGLGAVRFESAWHGRIAMTPDHMPRIHRLDAGLYTPIGYNGRGITTGTIFGQAIAGLLTGQDADTLPLPLSAPVPDRAAWLRARAYAAAFAANQAVRGVI